MAPGKAVAERTRLAGQAHKKAASEAAAIIENNKAKNLRCLTAKTQKAFFNTTTQWLSVIGNFVSMIGIYYKRKEIKIPFHPTDSPAIATSACGLQTNSKKRDPTDGLKKSVERFRQYHIRMKPKNLTSIKCSSALLPF